MPFTIDGAVDMETSDAISNGFKIAIIGEPGSGKSWLAASCASEEEKAFFFDFDGRKASIAGKKNVTAKTYYDYDFPNRMAEAWFQANNDLMQMEIAKERGELPYKWFIFDSNTYGAAAAMNHVMYNTPGMRRELNVAGRKTYIPKSFDAYKAEQAEVYGFWSRLMCLGNLIVIFHADAERAPDYTPENPKFTGKLTVSPPRYGDSLALFNDQWIIRAEGPNNYIVQTQPDYTFTAKNTLRLDNTETPDIRAMMQKYMTRK